MAFPYVDRADAGRQLAAALLAYSGRQNLLVLALPRGGVPVGFEVAQRLHAPLDLMLVRKLGFPGQEELAMGAIAAGPSGIVTVLNEQVLKHGHVPRAIVDEAIEHEQRELRRRDQAYRGSRPHPQVRDRTVILVDDGLATGSTMLAAVRAVRQQQPASVVVAVPVSPPETIEAFRSNPQIDDIICPAMPDDFGGVGRWYDDFAQTSDDEVRDLLDRAWSHASPT